MNGKVTNISLVILSAVLLITALYLIFMWVPTEANQGIVQRVFYFHVPSAWVAFLAFFLVFLGGLVYLKKRDPRWDIMAYSAAEIGVVFTTITLISGVIWAKPIWFVWWTWDARLTSTLVLWLMYVAYLLVRAYAPVSQAPAFGAVLGIMGFVDVPIVFLSIRWWRVQHPTPVIGGGPDSGLPGSMLLTLMVSLAAFTALFFLLLRLRYSLRQMEGEIEELKLGGGI